MRVVTGSGTEPSDAAAVRARLGAARFVLVDLGCGDGAFPAWAAAHAPDWLCVGLDPNAERMAAVARRARRKPARGGRDNLVLAVGALEDLPGALAGRAHAVTVNFPWAGLLARVAHGDPALAAALTHLAAPDACCQILVNADAALPDLPDLSPDALRDALAPGLARAGFTIDVADWLPPGARVHSQWGGRLIRGSRRRIARLRASRGRPAPEVLALLDAALRGTAA